MYLIVMLINMAFKWLSKPWLGVWWPYSRAFTQERAENGWWPKVTNSWSNRAHGTVWSYVIYICLLLTFAPHVFLHNSQHHQSQKMKRGSMYHRLTHLGTLWKLWKYQENTLRHGCVRSNEFLKVIVCVRSKHAQNRTEVRVTLNWFHF